MILGLCVVLQGLFNLTFAATAEASGAQDLKLDSRSLGSSSGSKLPVPEARFWRPSIGPFKWLLQAILSTLIQKQTALSGSAVPDGRCYEDIGCFNHSQRMGLEKGGPQPPEVINATFYFFDNASSDEIEKLLDEKRKDRMPEKTWTIANWTLERMNGTLNTSKPLAVLTHGLTGSKRTPWMKPLVQAILTHLECTVLVVDWEKGAAGTWSDAAVNTPMVGALISVFLQKVINQTNCTIHPENITLVGFSMGGQVMGFVGRHFKNATSMPIGRIAGLDPAGYLFSGRNYCLSKDDADYVDVIHTHGGSIYRFKIGLVDAVGHVDFYPNGGITQTGCQEKPSLFNFMETFTCSHYRAPQLFIESLNSTNCSFVSYHCHNWTEYENKNCFNDYNISGIGEMGYYSYRATGRGRQYLYTNAHSPYCRGNNTEPPEKKPKSTAETLYDYISMLLPELSESLSL